MSRKTARLVFTAVLILLPLQYVIVGFMSVAGRPEPWPAIVLPAFKSVWDQESYVTVPRTSFQAYFADGAKEIIGVDDLFKGIPPSHHLGLLRRQFTPRSMSGTRLTEQAHAPTTYAWLDGRISELAGGREPVRLDVVWYMGHFTRSGERVTDIAIDTLRIDFGRE